jgi:hypothetical protein
MSESMEQDAGRGDDEEEDPEEEDYDDVEQDEDSEKRATLPTTTQQTQDSINSIINTAAAISKARRDEIADAMQEREEEGEEEDDEEESGEDEETEMESGREADASRGFLETVAGKGLPESDEPAEQSDEEEPQDYAAKAAEEKQEDDKQEDDKQEEEKQEEQPQEGEQQEDLSEAEKAAVKLVGGQAEDSERTETAAEKEEEVNGPTFSVVLRQSYHDNLKNKDSNEYKNLESTIKKDMTKMFPGAKIQVRGFNEANVDGNPPSTGKTKVTFTVSNVDAQALEASFEPDDGRSGPDGLLIFGNTFEEVE